MEENTFFKHYRVCRDDNGNQITLGRVGPAMNYKAIDTRSNEPVVLHLIPLATVDEAKRAEFQERARIIEQLDHVNIAKVIATCSDDNYVGIVSEFVEGETVDSWVMAHGPLPADAVLRIGVQIVRALASAAFLGLTHRAIQPSNILIIGGQTVDGGWPFVKLMNFGLAGLEIYSDGTATQELSSSVTPQFASPEQLLQRPLDFRSEMYSLGATMTFLLTGAVPLAVTGMKARLRARRLPGLRRAPRALRNLLQHMLRENPENRPQDPVAFEREIQDCLLKVQRREELGRKLGISLAVVPRSTSIRSTTAPTPMQQVWRGALAFAALLLLGGIAAAFFLPEDMVPFRHRTAADKEIGVPVGVPSPGEQTSDAAAQPAITPPLVSNWNQETAQNNQEQSAPKESDPTSPAPVAVAAQTEEPPPPAESAEAESDGASANVEARSAGTDETAGDSTEAEKDRSRDASASDSSSGKSKQQSVVSSASRQRSTIKHSRTDTLAPNEFYTDASQLPPGYMRAHVVGRTPDGRVILRLPSGRVVVARRHSIDNEASLPHRRIIEQRTTVGPAPYQPFDPGN